MAGNHFGQAGDYSQTFAFLAQQNLSNIENRADAADARRERDQAAKDELFFERYQQGQVSDEEVLDYIRKRIRETSYDKAQQTEWKKALMEYTESINDSRALREFERTNDYGAYIAYLRNKMQGMDNNAAAKLEIEQQIRQLTDERDQRSINRGADRIMAQIDKGQATYNDLLNFYRERRAELRPGSPMREQLTDAIRDTAKQIRAMNLDANIGRTMMLFNSEKISPQQAGKRLMALANSSGLATSDPGRYYSMMDDANRLMRTVDDDGQLQKIDYLLATGQIGQREAQRRYEAFAENYKTAGDEATYWEIRARGFEIGNQAKPINVEADLQRIEYQLATGQISPQQAQQQTEAIAQRYFRAGGTDNEANAWSLMSRAWGYGHPDGGGTPLPRPGLLGNLGGKPKSYQGPMGQFRYISQLDGSEFSQTNCVMAAGAMLASVMGTRGLNGGDLRYLSGDRSGGTNLDQLAYALGRAGVKGFKNRNSNPMDFQKFAAAVGNGRPAVLMGLWANVPDKFKPNASFSKGHGLFIADYDPKKGFLVMDPAVSKNQRPGYKGDWWPANVVQQFGWGPSRNGYSFNGQVMLAPQGTVQVGPNGRIRPQDVRYVNVDDKPLRRETPPSYHGRTNPGPTGQAPGVHRTNRPDGKPRAGRNKRQGSQGRRGTAWVPEEYRDQIPETVEQVEEQLSESQEQFDMAQAMSDAWVRGEDFIEIAGERYPLTEESIRQMDRTVLDYYDYNVLIAESAGLDGRSARLRMDRARYIDGVQVRNTIPVNNLWNTILRDAGKDLARAEEEEDPDEALKIITGIHERMAKFAQNNSGNKTKTQLDDIDPETDAKIAATIQLFDIADDTEMPPDQKIQALQDAADKAGISLPAINQDGSPRQGSGDGEGILAHFIAEATGGIGAVQRGEAVKIHLPDGTTAPVPMMSRTVFDANGQAVEVTEPDLSGEIQRWQAAGFPVGVTQIVRDTKRGPVTMIALSGAEPIGTYLIATKNHQDSGLTKGQAISAEDVARLGEDDIQALMAEGVLTREPVWVPTIVMPTRTVNGVKVAGSKFYQDQATGLWYKGRLPLASRGQGVTFDGQVVLYDPATNSPAWEYRPHASASGQAAPYDGFDGVRVQQMIDSGELQVPNQAPASRDGTGQLSAEPQDLAVQYLRNTSLDKLVSMDTISYLASKGILNKFLPQKQATGDPFGALRQFSEDALEQRQAEIERRKAAVLGRMQDTGRAYGEAVTKAAGPPGLGGTDPTGYLDAQQQWQPQQPQFPDFGAVFENLKGMLQGIGVKPPENPMDKVNEFRDSVTDRIQEIATRNTERNARRNAQRQSEKDSTLPRAYFREAPRIGVRDSDPIRGRVNRVPEPKRTVRERLDDEGVLPRNLPRPKRRPIKPIYTPGETRSGGKRRSGVRRRPPERKIYKPPTPPRKIGDTDTGGTRRGDRYLD